LQLIEQAPALQLGVPFVALQASPHPPQLPTEVLMLVSQPLAVLPSQSPNPGLQLMPQVPLLQLGVPPLEEHTVVQMPQWFGSFLRSASQPSETSALQLEKPDKQVMPQAPAVQLAVPWFVLHAVVQLEQWVESVLRLTSQPLLASPSQLPKPDVQVMPHTPAAHVEVPFDELHTFPHALQFAGLVLRFASQPLVTRPSQLPNPVLQVIEQTPAVQAGAPLVEPQAVVQLLQCRGSVLRSVSQPLAVWASQLPQPEKHAMLQVPVAHVGVPWVLLQTVAQVPQWVVSALRLTSQPLLARPSQLPKPAEQLMPHTPPEQVAAPLVPLQAFPQELQFAGLVLRLVSQPLDTLPSQLPQPAAHVMPQDPFVHEAVPLAVLHAVVQVLQCSASVSRFDSQPLVTSESQLPQLAAQVMPQAPLAQLAVPWLVEHTVVQVPQCTVSVPRFDSQPLRALLSQLP
jgi:hypothetical protein